MNNRQNPLAKAAAISTDSTGPPLVDSVQAPRKLAEEIGEIPKEQAPAIIIAGACSFPNQKLYFDSLAPITTSSRKIKIGSDENEKTGGFVCS